MGNASQYLVQLLPELIVTVGACVALFVGLTRGSAGRDRTAAVSLAALLLALLAALLIKPDPAASPPGLLLTSLVYYVRLITLAIGVLILLVNWHVPTQREQGEFFAMVLFSVVGILFTASANDLVVLFFAIELGSVPTYVLIGLSREDRRASEASVKYFFLGAMAAALMVYGFSFLYGAAGTTALQSGHAGALVSLFAADPVPSFAMIGLLLAVCGLLFKVAAVPFHVYAPDVYEGAASPITGLLGFLPKLAGFVALVKVLSACGWAMPVWLQWMLWIVAALTMTVGNVLALRQDNVKRTLAYSSIAHTGYMLIAILVGPMAGEGPMRDGVAAMLFYIAIYGMMNLGAFAVLAALSVRGEAAEEFSDLAGLSRRHPGAAVALAVCAFSLMGFPPTAGFLGKVYVFSSAFSLGDGDPFRMPLIVLAVIGVINSAIAAVYYLRIAGTCYLRDPLVETQPAAGQPLRVGVALCSLAMLVLFVWPKPVVEQAKLASDDLQIPAAAAAPAPEVAAAGQPD
ncbi:MAG: NADH-quinone oxidoreductase subunit N [Phycisphaerales bacterium]|nr:MAG: NADH-quinone oxidoreductase subunit N [Phycisphaerales bacterium]